MSFGGGGKSKPQKIIEPPYTPTAANSSVILSSLYGMKVNATKSPGLSTNFGTGGAGGMARRPNLQKRAMLGGM